MRCRHDDTLSVNGRVPSAVAVRVDLDPKWLRRWWRWCVWKEGGEEEGERGGGGLP